MGNKITEQKTSAVTGASGAMVTPSTAAPLAPLHSALFSQLQGGGQNGEEHDDAEAAGDAALIDSICTAAGGPRPKVLSQAAATVMRAPGLRLA